MAQDLLRRWDSLTDQARAKLACELIKAANPEIRVQTLDKGARAGGQLHYLVSKLAASPGSTKPPPKSTGPWKPIGIAAAVLIGLALLVGGLVPHNGGAPASGSGTPGPTLSEGALYSVTEDVLACGTTDAFDEWGQFEKANDTRSRAAYLLAGKCTLIQPGQTITLMDLGMFNAKVVKDGDQWYVGRGAVDKYFRPAHQ